MPHQWRGPHTSPFAGGRGMRRKQWCHFTGLPVHGSTSPPTRPPGSRSYVQAPCLPKLLQPRHPPTPGANSCLSHGPLTGARQPCTRVVSLTGLPTRPGAGRRPAEGGPRQRTQVNVPRLPSGAHVWETQSPGAGGEAGEDPLRVAFGLMEGWRRLPARPTLPSRGLAERQCPEGL